MMDEVQAHKNIIFQTVHLLLFMLVLIILFVTTLHNERLQPWFFLFVFLSLSLFAQSIILSSSMEIILPIEFQFPMHGLLMGR